MPGLADAGMTGRKSVLKFLNQVCECDQAVLLLTTCPVVGDVDVQLECNFVVACCRSETTLVYYSRKMIETLRAR